GDEQMGRAVPFARAELPLDLPVDHIDRIQRDTIVRGSKRRGFCDREKRMPFCGRWRRDVTASHAGHPLCFSGFRINRVEEGISANACEEGWVRSGGQEDDAISQNRPFRSALPSKVHLFDRYLLQRLKKSLPLSRARIARVKA